MFNFLKKQKFGTGALEDQLDLRDYKFDEIAAAAPAVDWDKGYDVEKEANIKIPIKNQNGSSSCFHANTPVLMEDFTYRNISEIKVGDYVYTHKGNKKRVTQVFKKKWQGTVKNIKVWGDYRHITATSEHPFYALKMPQYNRYYDDENKKTCRLTNEEMLHKESPDFYPIEKLNKQDYIAFPFNNVVADKTIYECEKDPDFLWLLGLYLAEGSCSKYDVALSLHKNEFDWYEKIKQTMSKYGANVTYSFKKDSQGLTIYIFGKKWKDIFYELGGKLCDKKQINKRLMFLSPYLQMQIYQGFADGDGYRQDNRDSLVSTSKQLLLQLRIILLRNKIYSSLQKRKKAEDRKQVWVLEISKNKPRYSFIRDNCCFVLIKSVEHCKSYAGGHVYNIEVADDNSYQVNGMAVHNCVGQGWSYYIAILNAIEIGSYNEVSAKAIYSQIALPQGGAYIKSGGKLTVDWGSVMENIVPSYDNGKSPTENFVKDLSWRSEEINKTAKILQAKEYRVISNKDNMDNFAVAIRDNYGVVGGLRGENNATWSTNEPKPPKVSSWAHCIYYGKYGIDKLGKYIATPNSWGTRGTDTLHPDGWQKLREDYVNGLFQFNPWTLVDKPNQAMSNEADLVAQRNEKKVIIEAEGAGRKGIIINGKLRQMVKDRESAACLYTLTNNGMGIFVSTNIFDKMQKAQNF